MEEEIRLIRKIQRTGDRAAADRLIRKYFDEIYAYVYKQTSDKHTAMNVTQNIFMAVLQSMGNYDAKKASFRTWLYRIATNKTIDYYRSRAAENSRVLRMEEIDVPDESEFTRRIETKDLWTRVQRYIRSLEVSLLGDVMDTKMRKFSGGMIQRVGIAQAMLNDPKILILDEPTAGLDPKERVRFRNLISELSKDRIVILSTHIVSDIETIANRVIMLKDRTLFCNDSPANICHTLSGKVYETWEIESVAQPHFPLTQRQEDGRTLVRFVCETGCPKAARPVTPNLEDVFLYVYRDQVM